MKTLVRTICTCAPLRFELGPISAASVLFWTWHRKSLTLKHLVAISNVEWEARVAMHCRQRAATLIGRNALKLSQWWIDG
jgi:hypothetical protein